MSETEIRAVIEARRRALHDRDAVAFLAGYAPQAVIFDLAPPLSHGLDPAGVAAWLATWDGPVVNETRDLVVTVQGRLAHTIGLERLAGTQGGAPRDVWLRLTLCLRRDGTVWRITHEHTSLPVRKTAAGLLALADLRP